MLRTLQVVSGCVCERERESSSEGQGVKENKYILYTHSHDKRAGDEM